MSDPGERARAVAEALLPPGVDGEIHLTAIGGVGMVALAGLLRELGLTVRGSDLDVYPPASTELERLGVAVAHGYRPENLEPRPALVVLGNTIPALNPEAVAARVRGIPTISLPEALRHFCLPGRTPLVVAGTHGKTTTSSFLAWVLRTAGRDPGWFVGGAPLDLPRSHALGSGPEFVLEGDEYDTAYFDKGPKFLHYAPRAVLLNAVEFDHADIYRDLEHVKSSFDALLALVPEGGPVLVCADFPHALDVARRSGRAFESFAGPGERTAALAEEPDHRLGGLEDRDGLLRFELSSRTGERLVLESPVLGAMNARNLAGAALLARRLGVSDEAIVRAARTFHGVRRRQQVVVDGPVVLVDDFAHHPTAIVATLAAVRARWPGRRLVALFDPRSNTTRRRVFQDAIADALGGADAVVVGPVHLAERLAPEERFSAEEAAARAGGSGTRAFAARDHEEVVRLAQDLATPGSVIVALSNGAFGGVVGRLSAAFGSPAPAQ